MPAFKPSVAHRMPLKGSCPFCLTLVMHRFLQTTYICHITGMEEEGFCNDASIIGCCCTQYLARIGWISCPIPPAGQRVNSSYLHCYSLQKSIIFNHWRGQLYIWFIFVSKSQFCSDGIHLIITTIQCFQFKCF